VLLLLETVIATACTFLILILPPLAGNEVSSIQVLTTEIGTSSEVNS
jgi:amino acid permease